MSIQMLHPETLPPAALDAFLARGWYRMGQAVFTCRYSIFGGALLSTIWTRLDLRHYAFRKGLRRILSQNERLFRVEIRPAALTTEKERLFQRYRAEFRGGTLSPSLEEALYDDDDRDIFRTWESAVYDGGRLVAFSFFDLGHDSLQSVMGVYDPDYKQHSLGFLTMLLEIRYGREAGLRYFYPGYVVPGYPAFDYKLRVGALEAFQPRAEAWVPYDSLQPSDLPHLHIQQALADAQQHLQLQGIPSQLRLYPLYRSAYLDPQLSLCLKHPLFLDCPLRQGSHLRLVVAYDDLAGQLQADICLVLADLSDQIPAEERPPRDEGACLHLLQPIARLAESPSPLALARAIGRS